MMERTFATDVSIAFEVDYNGAWQTKVCAESLCKSFTPPGFCEPAFAVRAAPVRQGGPGQKNRGARGEFRVTPGEKKQVRKKKASGPARHLFLSEVIAMVHFGDRREERYLKHLPPSRPAEMPTGAVRGTLAWRHRAVAASSGRAGCEGTGPLPAPARRRARRDRRPSASPL